MRRSICTYLIIFCSWSIVAGQAAISGIVLDSTNRQPIPFATVYFDGTTNGQTTDEAGQFTLSPAGMELPAILVVSHISYAPLSLLISEHKDRKIELILSPSSQTINTVTVQDRDRRQENLEEFRRLFLGVDEWGRRSRIKNEEALVFNRDYRRERLDVRNAYMKRMLARSQQVEAEWAADSSYLHYDKVINFQTTATAPLIIELPDLGYTLQLDLVRFQIDYEQGRSGSLGYYFFQPYEGFSGKPRARHRRNRQSAYYHSPQHFLRALFTGKLPDNGYRLMEQSEGNTGNLTDFDPTPFLHQTGADQMRIKGLRGRKLIILYYGNGKGEPLPPARWKRAQPLQSGLFIGADECLIRADGTMGDSELFFSGSLGGHGVAWSLPSNYE
jgi:hypothetical protein